MTPFNIIGINVLEVSVTSQDEAVALADAVYVRTPEAVLQMHFSSK
jgi:hypothetical protein